MDTETDLDAFERAFRARLLNAIDSAAMHGNVAPVNRTLTEVPLGRLRTASVAWVARFGPVAESKDKPGEFVFSRHAKLNFNYQLASITPIWSSKTDKRTYRKSDIAEAERVQPKSVTREIDKKQARAALTRFLANPDVNNWKTVLEMCADYQHKWHSKARHQYISVVPGGLPSLGKGAR
jgi:hypothetical protein